MANLTSLFGGLVDKYGGCNGNGSQGESRLIDGSWSEEASPQTNGATQVGNRLTQGTIQALKSFSQLRIDYERKV
jgi:hypothetical protein